MGGALVGCGYTPVYGPGGGAAELRGAVRARDPRNLNEFDFVTQLERRLGAPDAAKFDLNYSISTSVSQVTVTPERELTRFNVIGTLTFSVLPTGSSAPVTSGKVNNFAAYSVSPVAVATSPPRTSSTISALSAKRDAYARLMVALADQMVTQLLATSPDWAK